MSDLSTQNGNGGHEDDVDVQIRTRNFRGRFSFNGPAMKRAGVIGLTILKTAAYLAWIIGAIILAMK